MPTMTPEERHKLIAKLNAEIEDTITAAKAKNYKYEDNSSIVDTHPAFMSKQPTQEEIDNNPLLKGLQDIKYDPDDTPYDQALAHKKDGNFHFKLKKYKTAILAYTEGIKTKCDDKEMICILYTNRAAAHYHLENFRSSLLDATKAVQANSDRVKSLLRCAQCCNKLKRYKDAIDWCRIVLSLEETNSEATSLLEDSKKQHQILERDARKQKLAKEKVKKANKKLLNAIKSRGATLEVVKKEVRSDDEEEEDDLSLASLEISSSGSASTKVYLDEDNSLIWPVMLVYPEHKTTDFIQAFNENSIFYDHLAIMFEQKPDWDLSGYYKLENLEVYYENQKTEILYKVSVENTLRNALANNKYIVRAGTPSFFILSNASKFYKPFLSQYKKVLET